MTFLTLFNSLEEGLDNDPDLIVISNPTSLHYEVAQKAAERNINIFVEKPFSHNLDGFNQFENLVLKNKLYFFVSYQRRFHPYLNRIKGIIESGILGKIITANFNVATYLPIWHPYEDYKQLYACKPDLGGGVLLTEIHELDLCFWYFGLPEFVNCVGGNYSDIEITVSLVGTCLTPNVYKGSKHIFTPSKNSSSPSFIASFKMDSLARRELSASSFSIIFCGCVLIYLPLYCLIIIYIIQSLSIKVNLFFGVPDRIHTFWRTRRDSTFWRT